MCTGFATKQGHRKGVSSLTIFTYCVKCHISFSVSVVPKLAFESEVILCGNKCLPNVCGSLNPVNDLSSDAKF